VRQNSTYSGTVCAVMSQSAVKSRGTTDFIQRLIDGVTGTTPITGTSSSTLSNDEALIMKFSKHLTDMGSMELICNAYGNCSAMPSLSTCRVVLSSLTRLDSIL